MDTLKNIQGVIFDYGGTIDTNSCHWAEVLWTKYMEHQVPVDKESFREAYVLEKGRWLNILCPALA